MKSNDGMTALGTYAVSGLKTKPDTGDYEAGVVAGQDLPEAWWNFFLNAFTSNGDITKDRVANILAELTTVLASSGLTPDNATTTQVDAALKTKYLSRLGTVVTDFNALSTTGLPQGSVTSFYTDVGYTNGPAGATVQTGFILRSKTVDDNAILLAFGNVTAIGDSNYPIYFRVRTAGTWLGWTSLLGGNNAASTATASTVMLRDAAGRSKVVVPADPTDIALKSTVTTDIATHQAIDLAHQATSEATASKIMARDAAGRAKVAAPAAEDDIARKAEITAEALLARNAANLTSGLIPDARIASVAPHAIVRLTSGSGNWTVPVGVTRIKVTCVGGGGGGGGGMSGGYQWAGGGGGGTNISDVIGDVLTVIPGSTKAYAVGGGGSAGVLDGTGGTGSSTTFEGATTGVGGAGGFPGVNGYGTGGGGAGPAGGAGCAGSHGAVKFVNGTTYASQGGKGGGAGGRGGCNNQGTEYVAAVGSYGGGGGGGYPSFVGAAGGSGIIIIEY